MPSPIRRWALAALAVGAVLYYAIPTQQPPAEAIAAQALRPNYAVERAAKDSLWRYSPDSPLPDSLKTTFRGLTYFSPNDTFRIVAQYTALPQLQPLLVPLTHREAPEPYVRVGKLEFELNGKQCVLTALRRPAEPADAPLFLPFTDATNGHQTFGGGRYLNVAVPAGGTAPTAVTLDFNLAYAPTCAHAPHYECPIPPAENALLVAVRAGER
jgi:uncharacterized protein